MGEDNKNPAGLGGKLYFCRKEDFEKDPNTPKQEVELTPHVGDISMFEDEQQERENGYSSMKGFTITGTATLEATPKQQRLIHRLAYGHGRLPRRRKKQVMNRVLRHDNRICKTIALLTHQMFSESDVLYLMAQVMFQDKVQGNVLAINEAEYHTAYLCLKRIKKKYGKYINQQELWKKD